MKVLNNIPPLYLLGAGAGTLLLIAGYFIFSLGQQLSATQLSAATTEASLLHNIGELQQKLAAAETLTNDLQTLLRARTEEYNNYNAEIKRLASTVGMLDKLSKTDRELLQKYSSVYFLNENYVPLSLAPVDPSYINQPERDVQFHALIYPNLKRLLDDARAADVPLQVRSAYRSFDLQETIKNNYKVTYGAGSANQFSADQGYSEHQLGSTVDFTTPTIGGTFKGFEKSPAYTWLKGNAHQYGFVLSYPAGNSYFQFEPWHWRFVGVELATRLHTEQKFLYDLDQRDINQYLAKIFD